MRLYITSICTAARSFFVILVLVAGYPNLAVAQTVLSDVSSSFTQSRSGLVLNRATNTYDAIFTLQYTGTGNLIAPLQAVLDGLPPGVTLQNTSGATQDGKPFVNVPLLDGYAVPNEQFRQRLAFSNPTRISFTFGVRMLAATQAAPSLVSIVSPANGESISSPTAVVTGTLSASASTGVAVNGVPACVVNNAFFANGVAVIDKIEAVAKSPAGAVGTAFVLVSPASQLVGLKVSSQSTCGGVAPFRGVFALSPVGVSAASIQQIEADFDGDGTVDLVSTDITQSLQFTYTAQKDYVAHFILREVNGTAHHAYHVVSVQDVLQAQQPFQSLVASFQAALVAGNIEHALTYFTEGAQARYGPVLRQIGTQLATDVAGWSPIQPVLLGSDYTEFAVTKPVNNTPTTFRIGFVRDQNGVWKMETM